MASRHVATAILVAVASALHGQPPGEKPSFEVASVKPAPPPDGTPQTRVNVRGGPGTDSPGQFTCQNCGLALLVTQAYGLNRIRLSGPDWIYSTRFHVAAKIPEGTTREQFPLMLQNLLADRFKLTAHFEKKEMQAYELTVAKGGPKMKPSSEDSAVPPTPPADQPRFFTSKIDTGKTTMESLASTLATPLGAPVQDATGLKGRYDVTLFWVGTRAVMGRGRAGGFPSPDGNVPPPGPDPDRGPDIFDAVRTQLGLELKQKKGPVDILVIDHAEKVPTEN
jgi:uncharacterized protein (TIGR03435 family)